jgi:heterodisulfide reductase subunit A-like polyferredoxin
MKVYLVGKGISIGDVMAQIEKIFPANDCSACILSLKLVEVRRHSNVEILIRRTVNAFKGELGGFKVKFTRHPGSSTGPNVRATEGHVPVFSSKPHENCGFTGHQG